MTPYDLFRPNEREWPRGLSVDDTYEVGMPAAPVDSAEAPA